MPTIAKYYRTNREFIITIAMMFVSLMGTIFGIIPTVNKVIAIRNHSIELSKSNQVLRTKIGMLESKDINTYRNQFAQLIAAVPGDKSLPTVFTTLDALGAQSGVTLTEFTLAKIGSIASGSGSLSSAEEKLIGSNLLPFTITVNGSYDQIYAFLSQVNNVRRFFRVRNFGISFEDTSAISVEMGMDAFYAPVSSAIGIVESPLEPMSAGEEDLIAKISQMPLLSQAAYVTPVNAQSSTTQKADLFSP